MTEHSVPHDHFTSHEPYPDPTAASYRTRYATSRPADHSAARSGRADAGPRTLPLPPVEPVTMRVGVAHFRKHGRWRWAGCLTRSDRGGIDGSGLHDADRPSVQVILQCLGAALGAVKMSLTPPKGSSAAGHRRHVHPEHADLDAPGELLRRGERAGEGVAGQPVCESVGLGDRVVEVVELADSPPWELRRSRSRSLPQQVTG